MTDKELTAVFAMEPVKRYSYFIKKVADFEELWGLFDSNWGTISKEDGQRLILLWPKKEYALKMQQLYLPKYKVKTIHLEDFMFNDSLFDNCLYTHFAIMYNGINYMEIDWVKIREDLQEELNNY